MLGAIHDLIGDHREALESYRRAEPVLGDEKSASGANLQYEIGITFKNLGNYAEAERRYARALGIYTELGDKWNQAVTLGNLGVLYGVLGEDERALGFTLRALALVREVHDRRGEAEALLDVAELYWRLGNTPRAIDALNEELAVVRSIGMPTEEALAYKNLGDIHLGRGELSAARDEYGRALDIQRRIGERRTEGPTLIALSDVELREHHVAEALRLAGEALSIARSSGHPELEWNARRTLAAAEVADGRTADAITELRTSARIINDLRSHVAGDTSKIAFVDERQDVFENLAKLLVAAGRPGEALEAAEAGRARAFADLLEQRQILGKPHDRGALAAVRRAQGELAAAATGPSDEGAAPAPARSSPRLRAAAAFDASLAALDVSHREMASLLTADSPKAADISRAATTRGAAFLEYLVTDRTLLIWVVDPSGSIHHATVTVPRERLASLIRTVRETIAADTSARAHPAGHTQAALRELDRLLIAPVARWLPSSPETAVIVVPHGPLALLPFAALEDPGGRTLIARHVLASAPSASVYAYTEAKRRAALERPQRALIVADPVPPPNSGIEPLPGALDEGRRVAARLRTVPLTLLTGSEATEAVVKRNVHDYSLLHFATHGLVAPDRPLASSLVLSADGEDDGYLRVDEIFNMDLAADLVVLSGCSTGLGHLTGDGILGLTRAFLYAGTPTVIVSQWNVSDRATTVLMDRFYAELARGRTKGQALRAAALATRARFPNAASWAPFELVGEP